jgi:hypothetical protein
MRHACTPGVICVKHCWRTADALVESESVAAFMRNARK